MSADTFDPGARLAALLTAAGFDAERAGVTARFAVGLARGLLDEPLRSDPEAVYAEARAIVEDAGSVRGPDGEAADGP